MATQDGLLHNEGKTERKIQITQRQRSQSDHEFPPFSQGVSEEEAANAKCDKRTDGAAGARRRLVALPFERASGRVSCDMSDAFPSLRPPCNLERG